MAHKLKIIGQELTPWISHDTKQSTFTASVEFYHEGRKYSCFMEAHSEEEAVCLVQEHLDNLAERVKRSESIS